MTSEIAGGAWDITQLEAIEQDAAGNWAPTHIVDRGETFRLRATFDGNGAVWNTLENQGHVANVTFFAERLGAEPAGWWWFGGTWEHDFPTIQKVLAANGGPYFAESGDLTVTKDGIYKCGVTVTFEDANGVADLGTLGALEGLLLQVSEHEA